MITNYHVVAQVALEPGTYRLEYAGADGSRGEAQLVAVDLPNDLAIVRIEKKDAPFFDFDKTAVEGGLAKGERALLDGQSARSRVHHYRGHLQRTG